MKKSYILSSLALASLGFFAFQQTTAETSVVEKFNKEHLFSGGGQSGLTGAPGEANCTQCHTGSTQDGSTVNSFALLQGTTPVASYVPGTTYTATLQQTPSPTKSGFSSTTLDGTDAMAGNLIGAGIGGTQNFSSAGRDYVSHTTTSSAGSGQFAWSWISPATDVGPVTFYIASNVANNDGSTSGDVIYLSTHVIPSSASIDEEVANDLNFTAGYNATSNKLVLDFDYLAIGEMSLNLIDMNGRSVFTYNLGQSEIGENHETLALPELKDGMYVVHFFVGNKAMSANILVKK